MTAKPQSPAPVEITISVPEDTPLLSIRVMRGGRLLHQFDEPPPNSPEADADKAKG